MGSTYHIKLQPIMFLHQAQHKHAETCSRTKNMCLLCNLLQSVRFTKLKLANCLHHVWHVLVTYRYAISPTLILSILNKSCLRETIVYAPKCLI